MLLYRFRGTERIAMAVFCVMVSQALGSSGPAEGAARLDGLAEGTARLGPQRSSAFTPVGGATDGSATVTGKMNHILHAKH